MRIATATMSRSQNGAGRSSQQRGTHIPHPSSVARGHIGVGARLFAKPGDDGSPIVEVRPAERLIMRRPWNQENFRGRRAKRGQFRRHLRGKKPVFFAMHDEDRLAAIGERLLRVPNGRHQPNEPLGNPRCFRGSAKRRKSLAQNQSVSVEFVDRLRRHAAAEREAQD